MRLGLLGPAADETDALARAARHLHNELGADRVVYLGADRALDGVINSWAEELVGTGADDATVMTRATKQCLDAGPAEIREFLERERQRTQLRKFESLAGERTRGVELMAGKVAVMLYDKAFLEEEDILPASLLIFGKSREPLIKPVGRRWFLSPGSFPEHGMMLVDDEAEQLRAACYDCDFNEVQVHPLSAPESLRMRVTQS